MASLKHREPACSLFPPRSPREMDLTNGAGQLSHTMPCQNMRITRKPSARNSPQATRSAPFHCEKTYRIYDLPAGQTFLKIAEPQHSAMLVEPESIEITLVGFSDCGTALLSLGTIKNTRRANVSDHSPSTTSENSPV